MSTLRLVTQSSRALVVLALVVFLNARSTLADLNGETKLSEELRRDLGEHEESFEKRQSKIDVGVDRNPYGGISGNVGVSHTTSGGHTFGGSVNHNFGGGTSGTLSYSKSFDDGRGRIGAHVSRGFNGGGTSFGVGGSWRFRRNANAMAEDHLISKRQSKIDVGVDRNPYGGISGNVGVSHTTSGGHKFGGSVNHNFGGGTSGRLSYSKSFDNGRGRIGAHVSRGFNGGGTSFGVGGSWRFRRNAMPIS